MDNPILVTGANGQLGQELRRLSQIHPSHFLFTDADVLNITDQQAVLAYFQAKQPLACINCAAYTAVDKAEEEPALARLVNAEGPKHLAMACAQHGLPLLHVSTDFVFDGSENRPIQETAPTAPLGVYGATKRQGEIEAMNQCPSVMIVRTAWLYSSFGNNFVKTMQRLGKERSALGVVSDQIGSPTYAQDLAKTLLAMLEIWLNNPQRRENLAGIYHYSNEGVASWYDFAHAIMELSGLECTVSPILSEAYPTPARRPNYSVLDKRKIKDAFGLAIDHWRERLAACIWQIENTP